MKYFDTHTHTNDEQLLIQFNEIKKTLIENDFGMNIIGADLESSKLAVNQALEHNNFYASIGIHPDEILDDSLVDKTMQELENLYYKTPHKIKCIGECGIDLYRGQTNLDSQILWFKKQFELAKKLNLVLMIHARDAYQELLDVLKSWDLSNMKIIIHCYTGNVEYAQEFQKLGCYISIGGIVTFKNAESLRDVVRNIDLNLLITETDAPYLTPVPFRGKLNYPYYVQYVNEFIANLLNINIDKFNNLIMNNVKTIFNI